MDDQLFNKPEHIERRRSLRKNPTEPERRLWQAIRAQQLGVKFRRQQGIGPYIVDFYCAECALVAEVDGGSHFTNQAKAHDQMRDSFLRGRGLEVMRFTNEQIAHELDGVLELLFRRVRHRPSAVD